LAAIRHAEGDMSQIAKRLLYLALALSLVSASENIADFQALDPPQTQSDYEAHLRQFAVVIESQMGSIEELLPSEIIPAFRKRQDDWKRSQDLRCAKESRQATDQLAELRCLLEASQRRHDEPEAELVELESRQDLLRWSEPAA
jgi:hypothetical protein